MLASPRSTCRHDACNRNRNHAPGAARRDPCVTCPTTIINGSCAPRVGSAAQPAPTLPANDGCAAVRSCLCKAVGSGSTAAFCAIRRRRAVSERHPLAAIGRQAAAGDIYSRSEASRRIQELYGDVVLSGQGPYDELYGEDGDDGEEADGEDEAVFDSWRDEGEGEEEEEEEEDSDAAILARSVVQVRTLHRVPNFLRPWEEGHEAESTSSGFVVEVPAPGPGGRQGRQLLLMTTAGAVEHARKVEVSRSADESPPLEASVAAVCLDLDVALLRVEHPAFWDPDGAAASSAKRRNRGRGGASSSGRDDGSRESDQDGSGGDGSASSSSASSASRRLFPLPLDRELPHLRKPVVVAGFPLGGGNLCVTSGVVSRIEVVEYSHSGRALLALQVDAPLNNGGWGGPALCPATGRCVGMAFQKFTSQTWMERYDDAIAEMFGGGGDDEDDDGGVGGEGQEGDGGGGAPGQDYDEDAENIGYLVPAPLLQLVLDDYSRELSHQHASTSAIAATGSHGGGGGGGAAAGAQPGHRRGGAARGAAAGGRSPRTARAGGGGGGETHGSGPVYLDGRPRLGLRFQRMEAPAMRRAFAMAAGESGVLVTGVDPTGSAAGVLQVYDVLLEVAGRQVANDGTTLLRPGQRVLFGHWAAVGDVGGELRITVLRGGVSLDLSIRLRDAGPPFLPVSLGPLRRPQYLVVGPLVFVSFSLPYWYELMAGRQQLRDPATRRQLQSGFVPVLGALEWGMPTADDSEEVVLLTEVLECGEGADDDGVGGDDDGGGDASLSYKAAASGRAVPITPESGSDDVDAAATTADDDDDEPTASKRPSASRSSSSSSSADSSSGAGGSGSGSGMRGTGVGAEAAAWSELLKGAPRRLASVNGMRVRNLAQLAAAVVAAAPAAEAGARAAGSHDVPQFLRLGLAPESTTAAVGPEAGNAPRPSHCTGQREDGVGVGGAGGIVVLDAGSLAADTRAVLRHHSMGAAMAQELRKRLSTSWPFLPDHQAQGQPRQRRQQGRRVSMSGWR